MRKLIRSLLASALALTLVLSPAAALTVDEARALLEMNYVDEIPSEILQLDSIEEILAALGDPYTEYMTKEEYANFISLVEGQTITGIGVAVQFEPGKGILLSSVLPGSAAEQAGLQSGDYIVSVDGQDVTQTDGRALVRGEAGTTVTIEVLHASSGQRKSYTLERGEVQIPIVTYQLVDGIPVIECASFGSSTAPTIMQAIEDYEALPEPFLMDLRTNPGGTAEAAASTAGWFVGGQTIVYFRYNGGEYTYLYTSSAYPDLTDKTLIILTSPYSASASELFSAAIRDYGAGIAVGQRTYGKGVSQVIIDQSSAPDLFDGDGLKLTVSRFFSPDGATNDTVGVIPTLCVSVEQTPAVALLLANGQPSRADGFYRLELVGQTLYISREQAASDLYRDAFTELLEALPPQAVLSVGSASDTWTAVAPGALAAQLGLDYQSRGFTDTAGSPAAREIETLAAYQLISGFEDGTFQPESTITRAQFCAMVSTALNLRVPTQDLPFSDVASDSWYAPSVGAMYAKKLISGNGDGTFRPDDVVTYQEMVAVMASVAQWVSMQGYQAEKNWSEDLGHHYTTYDAWAQPSALVLDFMEVLDTAQVPQQPATRATAAQLLCHLMEASHLLWD